MSAASERDRIYIAVHHYACRGELDRALQAYRLWRDLYPNDVVPANNLVEIYLSLGESAKAAECARDAAALAPDNAIVLATLVRALRRNGEWARAKQVYGELVARGLDGSLVARLERIQIAVIEEDDGEIDRQVAWATGTTSEAEVLNMAAVIATGRGQGRAARALFERATRAAARSGLGELEAVCLREYAEYAAAVEQAELARSHIERALELLLVTPVAVGSGALIYASLGDVDRADELIREAVRRFPAHFARHRMVLPMARAIAHLKRGAPEAALCELRAIEPFDLSWQTELEAIYWRGAARLEAGRPADAVAQFRKLLGHWTFRPDSHFLALARVGPPARMRRKVSATWREPSTRSSSNGGRRRTPTPLCSPPRAQSTRACGRAKPRQSFARPKHRTGQRTEAMPFWNSRAAARLVRARVG